MNQKVLLVSPGGCACTAVIKFLMNHVHKINSPIDSDHLKHSLPWNPLVKKYNPTHIIYIYGDLDKAARSLFRRKYGRNQYLKLNNININSDIKAPFNNFNQYIRFVQKSRTEPLGMLNHFMAWKNVPKVFFIHYENIPKSSTIDDFLGIPKGTCSNFILKERTSEQNINETTEYLDIMKSFTDKLIQE
jgi:hypothetical protein